MIEVSAVYKEVLSSSLLSIHLSFASLFFLSTEFYIETVAPKIYEPFQVFIAILYPNTIAPLLSSRYPHLLYCKPTF